MAERSKTSSPTPAPRSDQYTTATTTLRSDITNVDQDRDSGKPLGAPVSSVLKIFSVKRKGSPCRFASAIGMLTEEGQQNYRAARKYQRDLPWDVCQQELGLK